MKWRTETGASSGRTSTSPLRADEYLTLSEAGLRHLYQETYKESSRALDMTYVSTHRGFKNLGG